MDERPVRQISGGVNQSGVRNYNERLLLSILQRNGSLSARDLATASGLSSQTISVILRKLEGDGLLDRGDPVKGKVGKPTTPVQLTRDGVLAIGLKLGRRSAELVLLDFHGNIRQQRKLTYPYPVPNDVFGFLKSGIADFEAALSPDEVARICGIGIAAPLQIWNWHEMVGAPRAELIAWKSLDIAATIAQFSALPVAHIKDATAACQAEHIYGRGKEFRDYAYFYFGAFIGGGIVLNHSVYEGHQGNAGAFGPLLTVGPNGNTRQLMDAASIYVLEQRLIEEGHDPRCLWVSGQDWDAFAPQVAPWLEQAAKEVAMASLSVCAVIDFEAVLIDGAFPEPVKAALVDKVRGHIADLDSRGLILPRIEPGVVGADARAIGAACLPIMSRFLLNTNTGMSLEQPA